MTAELDAVDDQIAALLVRRSRIAATLPAPTGRVFARLIKRFVRAQQDGGRYRAATLGAICQALFSADTENAS